MKSKNFRVSFFLMIPLVFFLLCSFPPALNLNLQLKHWLVCLKSTCSTSIKTIWLFVNILLVPCLHPFITFLPYYYQLCLCGINSNSAVTSTCRQVSCLITLLTTIKKTFSWNDFSVVAGIAFFDLRSIMLQ